jgi:hypothetical protein
MRGRASWGGSDRAASRRGVFSDSVFSVQPEVLSGNDAASTFTSRRSKVFTGSEGFSVPRFADSANTEH